MIMLRHALETLVAIMFVVMTPAVQAADPVERSPEEIAQASAFIQDLADRTIELLDNPEIAEDLRNEEFRSMLEASFDGDYIAKVVIGRYWRKMNAVQRDEYMGLFSNFMFDTLMSRLSAFNNEYLEVIGHSVTKRGDMFIKTQIVMTSENFYVDWRVLPQGEELTIIDVLIEGVSMVKTNHEEVTSIAFREGVEGVLSSLREHQEEETLAVPLMGEQPINTLN